MGVEKILNTRCFYDCELTSAGLSVGPCEAYKIRIKMNRLPDSININYSN